MRKNLFLALALIFASFATVNAQWKQTLSAVDGLPGIVDASTGCKIVKTGLITPSSPLNGVRVTICNTEAPELNAGVTMAAFAEFKVIDGDGKEVKFTPTSNSIQTGGADGGGMAALVDDNYTTYYHSFWGNGVSNDEGEYVYVELAFEAPVSSFRLMWVGRPNSHKFSPTLAVLTPAGTVGVPGEVEEAPAATYELGSRLTTVSALESSNYVTLKGNTVKEFTKDKEEYSWIGPRYFTGTNAGGYVAVDSVQNYSAKMAMQLIPASDGKFYFYWPEYNAYISKKVFDTVTNDVYWQAWQEGTTNIADAAEITITEEANGKFSFSYETTLNDAEATPTVAYIAAEPRDDVRGMKIFNGNFKAKLQNGDYSWGYGLPVVFEFDFFAAEYAPAAHLTLSELNSLIFDAALLSSKFGGKQDSEEFWELDTYYDNMNNGIATAQEMLDNGASYEEMAAELSALKESIIGYLYSVAWQKGDDLYNLNDELEAAGMFCSKDELEVGKYVRETFDAMNEAQNNAMNALISNFEEYGAQYEQYNAYMDAFKAYDAAIAEFYASKVTATPWPVIFSENEGLHVTGATVWKSPIIRPDFVGMNSFRITFLEVGPNNGMYDGYPMVCLSEFAVRDADGNKIPLTEANISCNSVETTEGSVANLFDGERSTFFHSIWGNGTFSPKGYVYFDVELPDTYVGIQLEWIARDHSNPLSPKKVYVGPYGETYDPIAESANPYNVSLGAQVKAASEIQDWGVYAIQGQLHTNSSVLSEEELGQAKWYGGRTPFHTTVLREDCAYFFTKNADGTFNIRSLKSSKFWAANSTEVNTTSEAAKINIEASANAGFAGQNTFVLYSLLPDTTTAAASWNYTNEETEDEINVEEVTVSTKYNVFMDWDGGLANRQCVSPQPGIADASIYGEQAEQVEMITDYLQAKSSAGDYLHFNKTNGEGEWKIYRLTMENPFYYWLTSLVGIADAMGMVEGPNPGQFVNTGSFAADFAAAQAVISATNYSGAEAAAKKLAASLEAATSGDLARNPMTEGIYILEAAHTGFQGNKAMYIAASETEANSLRWGSKPESYATAEGQQYLFEFISYPYADQLVEDKVISESEINDVYYIKNVATGEYLGLSNGTSTSPLLSTNSASAAVYICKRGTTDIYTVGIAVGAVDASHLHQAGHGNGAGSGGEIVTWNGDPNNTSASAWRIIRYTGETEEPGVPGDITGDEVVNVADVTSIVAMILDESLIENAADVNGDGVVNVADVTYVVSIILGTESASAPARAAAMSEEATPVVSASFDEDNTMYINVANPGYPFTAAQFDIKFEGGIGIVNDGEYYDVFLGSRTSSRNHSEPECNTQPDGSLRVVILSLKNKVFTGEEGDIATVALDVTGVADGVYQYTIKNIALSDPSSQLQYPADVVEWVSVNGGVIGEATGIDSITADGENANEPIYDLSGRKVSKIVKGGIYIKGNKKFIAE